MRAKRIRSDTFWTNTLASNAEFFQKILEGRHESYEIREADINLDFSRKERKCWRVYSKSTGQPADSVRSVKSYRLALAWAALSEGERSYFTSERRRKRLLSALPKIDTKRGDHTRHRCPNEWCCRPCHLQIGTRKENEEDKHFHHFLRNPENGVAKRFMDEFRELCKSQGIWGFYPPSK